MNLMTDDIEKIGEHHEANNNKPFLLSDIDTIWFIKKGAIDIFAVEYKKKVIVKRLHLGRIEEGNILFGLHDSEMGSKVNLVAIGIPDTEVISISRNQFQKYFQNEENILQIDKWVEYWLKQFVIDLLNESSSPKDFLPLVANETLSLSLKEFGLNLSETIWINNIEGGGVLWFNQTLTQETIDHSCFPIAPGCWVRAKENTRLSGIDTRTCIRENLILPSLDIFHQQIIPCIMEMLNRYKTDEFKHLRQKYMVEHQDFDRALHQLAALTKTKDSELYAGETGETLFDVCNLVARSIGVSLKRLRHKKFLDQQELLEDIIRKSKLMMRQVSLAARNWWTEDNGALLAFMKDSNQPVALIPSAHGGGYMLVDTITNTKIPVSKEIAGLLQDSAVMFFRTFPAKTLTLKELILFGLTGTYKDITRLILFGTLAGFFGIAVPYATGILFNTIIPGSEAGQLFQTIIILIVVTIAIAIFQMSNAIALLRIEGKVGVSTQAAIIERLFNLPAPFFRRFTSGDLAQRAFATDNIMQLVTGTTQVAILGGILSLFSWAYMFFINIELALMATFLIAIVLLIFVYLNFKRLKFERQYSELQGIVLNQIFQLLNGIVKLRIAGAEIKSFILWTNGFRDNVDVTIKAQRIMNLLVVFNAVFLVLASLVIFGFVELRQLTINTGDFLAFYAAFVQFSLAMLAMSVALTSSINAVPLYERAKPILQTLPECDETKIEPGELKGQIEVSHLAFRYDSDSPCILEDVNFQVSPGEFVALVGTSSSGKSTLMRLLIGLEKPLSGAIYYDKKNLSELDVQAVRRQIGIVIQNAKLLPGNIFTNIVGSSQATLEDAWEAARIAGFDEDIKAMPMGMNTMIAEGVSTISGGQRQRLIIARAIVNKPKIILFDEASSALDNLTQSVVSKNLQQLNATRIIIAHRLSTIMNSDRIFVIDQGRIVETGSYEELMKMSGHFAELAKRQLLK